MVTRDTASKRKKMIRNTDVTIFHLMNPSIRYIQVFSLNKLERVRNRRKYLRNNNRLRPKVDKSKNN